MRAPLFVIPDTLNEPPRRYMVKDKEGNILFITSLEDLSPENTAVEWAIKRGGWLAGLLEGARALRVKGDKIVLLSFGVDRPLYIVLDSYRQRFLVVDDDENVLFLTDLDDKEPEQTATLAAMKLGGWLKGVVKSSLK